MIIAPRLTEKSFKLTAEDKYVFLVDKKATKTEIKKAIEDMYKVNVISVSTISREKSRVRSYRTGKYRSQPALKKAIVKLKPKQKIDLFTTNQA
ncbi:50S ribosomal protein L23 [Candidatus Collierbacteria bacterium]|nr:50S ribosomal protein L23 [Candidatus Collierbacteria bacterium]